MSGSYSVLTGVWHNYSYNGWHATSLTLDVRSGAILVAGLAMFISVVGGRFWAILAFVIHKIRTTPQMRDGIHHQQQAIYRNSSTELSAVWLLLCVSWAWRGRSERNILRLLTFALPPLFFFVAFTVAGLFSTQVAAPTYAASAVRVRPQNCGLLALRKPEDIQWNASVETEHYKWLLQKTREATNYARACIGKEASALTGCDSFPVRALPYKTRNDAPCPFNGHRCVLGENGAFQLDSDWIDSHRHLGINAPIKDRIRLRRVTTCSVLRVDDLISSFQILGGNTYVYNLGPQPAAVGSPVPGIDTSNSTFSYRDFAVHAGLGYAITTEKAIVWDPYPSWLPISDLNRTDADTSIFFLNSNSMAYTAPVQDPFFAATKPVSVPTGRGNVTFYTPNNLTTVMGCTDQFQFQDPNTNTASELTGSTLAGYEIMSMGISLVQSATVLRITMANYDALLYNSVNGFGSAALLAQDITYVDVSPGLPDDQWHSEVEGWFNVSMATLQDRIVRFASKDINGTESFARLDLPADMPELKPMCVHQVVHNTGAYQTFSMLGVGIIVGVGLFVILLSFILEPLVGWLTERSKGEGNVSWVADSILQMQKSALQGKELCLEWEKGDGEFPVTKSREKFQALCYVAISPKDGNRLLDEN